MNQKRTPTARLEGHSEGKFARLERSQDSSGALSEPEMVSPYLSVGFGNLLQLPRASDLELAQSDLSASSGCLSIGAIPRRAGFLDRRLRSSTFRHSTHVALLTRRSATCPREHGSPVKYRVSP